ncbi:hypothetical protein BDN72DRAFT_293344 [Pluteus cervinus]|uniref:Uncharacterized protein n=1 Tax=Pluteus cervinus TaxID=181527 RepID=A0ACD3B475_9AGAR|nr:hypothetical protein BDN72DRAFT_293344 [Pluteus cervinus]
MTRRVRKESITPASCIPQRQNSCPAITTGLSSCMDRGCASTAMSTIPSRSCTFLRAFFGFGLSFWVMSDS